MAASPSARSAVERASSSSASASAADASRRGGAGVGLGEPHGLFGAGQGVIEGGGDGRASRTGALAATWGIGQGRHHGPVNELPALGPRKVASRESEPLPARRGRSSWPRRTWRTCRSISPEWKPDAENHTSGSTLFTLANGNGTAPEVLGALATVRKATAGRPQGPVKVAPNHVFVGEAGVTFTGEPRIQGGNATSARPEKRPAALPPPGPAGPTTATA